MTFRRNNWWNAHLTVKTKLACYQRKWKLITWHFVHILTTLKFFNNSNTMQLLCNHQWNHQHVAALAVVCNGHPPSAAVHPPAADHICFLSPLSDRMEAFRIDADGRGLHEVSLVVAVLMQETQWKILTVGLFHFSQAAEISTCIIILRLKSSYRSHSGTNNPHVTLMEMQPAGLQIANISQLSNDAGRNRPLI